MCIKLAADQGASAVNTHLSSCICGIFLNLLYESRVSKPNYIEMVQLFTYSLTYSLTFFRTVMHVFCASDVKCDPASLGVFPVNTAYPAKSLSVGDSLLNVAWRLLVSEPVLSLRSPAFDPCGLPNEQTVPHLLHPPSCSLA